jgi:hypothetical protein
MKGARWRMVESVDGGRGAEAEAHIKKAAWRECWRVTGRADAGATSVLPDKSARFGRVR